MKIRKYSALPPKRPAPGFALIVTITLMILLLVLGIGMLSLSTVAIRTASLASTQSEAQANARMALVMAIGELQRHVGNDMRITAPADILSPENPPLLGVWKSWEGTNQQQTGNLRGRPIAPDYASKTQPASSSNGRFLAWLVSGASDSALPGDAPSLVQKTPSAGTTPMLSNGTLADTDPRQVHLTPQQLGQNGAFAWWISGENQKALVPKPSNDANPSIAEWADRNGSHAVADPEPFGMDSVLADPELAKKAITRGSADFIVDGSASITPTQSFHDLSANSMGLLTNVATGGWRKDLSLLTEKWDEQATTGLEFFKISPTESLKYTRPANATDYQPKYSMLYHWADYRSSTLREFWARRGPIASWAKIKSYATLYKKMSATTSNAPNINHQSWVDNGTPENAALTFHDIRLLPQMARIQLIVSHYATRAGAEPGKFRPAVLYTPIITVWNPYNTRLTLNGTLIINPAYTWPLALSHKFTGSGAPNLTEEYWAVQAGSSSAEYSRKSFGTRGGHQDMTFTLAQRPLILEPGETRIFSPPAGTLNNVTGNSRIRVNLVPGVRTEAGFFFTLDEKLKTQTGGSSANLVSLPGSVEMGVDAKFDVPSRANNACGTAYQWFIDSFGSGRSHSWFQIFYDKQDAEKLYILQEQD